VRAATPRITESRDGRKRSLILVGGGLRVAWQAGAIRALADAGVVFQHADGTSSGILNLAMLLSGLSPQDVCDRWRTLHVKDFLSFAAPRTAVDLLDVEALGDADALVHRVLPHLGVDAAAIRVSTRLEGTFNVCDFARKVNEVIPHTRVDTELVVAGVSPPILMPPVNRAGTLYTDSLWLQGGNLMEAVRRGADVIWVLWCIGNTPRYGRGLLHQYTHLMELSANGALFEQLERIRELNERILAGEEVMGHRRPIAVHLVKPERPLPLDTELYDGRVTTASLIDMGYSDTWRYLSVRGEQGLPLTPEITLTTEPAPDLTFRESLTGPFVLGATDPMAGALHSEATPLTVHLTISVDDMDAVGGPNQLRTLRTGPPCATRQLQPLSLERRRTHAADDLRPALRPRRDRVLPGGHPGHPRCPERPTMEGHHAAPVSASRGAGCSRPHRGRWSADNGRGAVAPVHLQHASGPAGQRGPGRHGPLRETLPRAAVGRVRAAGPARRDS
jgi:predicted acylesterase/phospholipase RssA